MFPLVSATTIAPVLYPGWGGHASLDGLLVGGFFLGSSSGSAAPRSWCACRSSMPGSLPGGGWRSACSASAWAAPPSALTTVALVGAHGMATLFTVTAIVLALYAVLAALLLRDSLDRAAPIGSTATRLAPCG
ncbi:hypothetical protein BX266_7321 [Streptomyces sp. TLI_171]|nr:hypothetical protein BX266_7321 [Streptomyces sp. TLI_171]